MTADYRAALRFFTASALALVLAGCATTNGETAAADAPSPAAPTTTAQLAAPSTAPAWAASLSPVQQPRDFGAWGYDLTAMDRSVAPGDDFDRYASGAWADRTPIPSDQTNAGVDWDSYKVTEGQLRTIILEAPADSQLGALFGSFMDEARVDALGLEPLSPLLARIDAAGDKSAFARLMGANMGDLGTALIGGFPYADPNDPATTAMFIGSAGLGLPEKDYYFDDRFAKEREAYAAYLSRIFTQLGDPDPAATGASVMAFETEIARRFWSAEDRRDFSKINNPMTLDALRAYAPGIDWTAFFAGAGVDASGGVIVMDNTALRDVVALYAATPLDVLKAWQKAHTLHAASPYLADEFVQSRFAFMRVLSGTSELRPRWTRGIALVNNSLGEVLGEAYVARHFPPEAKARMEQMVANLKAVMGQRIATNAWMAPATKAAAMEKLAKMDVMVGYPDTFRDYSMLDLRPDDLLGNVRRVGANEWAYQRAKIGQPVDKSLWSMNPQELNAYNGAFENKIVFPAGILQPPMFSLSADDAVNYGAIGAVIGHEITHGFDDQGRKIDAYGRLRDWWTPGDAERFEELADAFGAHYARFEAAPGHFIKPRLTMGENIADMAGLRVALDAYHASLGGRPAPVIDGLTGDQRFFLAYAQAWQSKERPEAMIQQVSTGPHSPPRFRVLGPVRHIDEWYVAFDVRPGSAMYLPPEERVRIW